MTLSDSQQTVILGIRIANSFLSLFGTCYVLFSSLVFRQFRGLSSRLVLYLMASSGAAAAVNLMGLGIGINPTETPLCKAQGVTLQFFQQAQFLWVCAIAIHLFIGLVLHKHPKRIYEITCHIVIWTLASIYTILPATTKDYGPAGVWCWIKGEDDDKSGFIWRLAVFYIPLFSYVLLVFVIYGMSFRAAQRVFRKVSIGDILCSKKKTPGLAILQRLAIYPLIFVVVWLFPVINRIQNWINPDDEIFGLVLMQVLTAPLFGFWNSVFYSLDIALGTRYLNALRRRRICTCCVGTELEMVEQDDFADNYLVDMDLTSASSATGDTPKSSVVPSISVT
ncbi:slime mold cyclic amp receptor protein [Pelomyxa schiedti]|nr:slime mold cyclic amp receptor protein [Pelomyxa schiedti]